MTRSPFIDDTTYDDALRSLDVADPRLTTDQQARRDALWARLEATPRDAQAAPGGARRIGAHRTTRWIVAAAAVAGIAGALVVNGNGRPTTAYASWTPEPSALTAEQLATAGGTCLDELTHPKGEGPAPSADHAKVVVAERRGNFVFVAVATPEGSNQQCFFDAGDLTRSEGVAGGLADPDAAPPTKLSEGQVDSGGGGASSGPEGSYEFAVGRVGPGTKALTLRVDGQRIKATVNGEYFAAWWPTPAGQDWRRIPRIAYDVTTASGRVVTDAQNAFDSGMSAPAPGPRQIGGLSTGGGASEDGKFVVTVQGEAGAEVASVTVHSGAVTVEAPVRDGFFAAEIPSAGPEGPAPTFDLHLKDGTVLRGQTPVGKA